MFHQGDGADGTLVLEPPVPLTYRDGGTLLNSDIGRGLAATDGVPFPEGLPSLWREPSITLAACDWHRPRGVRPVSSPPNWYTFLLENSGTREGAPLRAAASRSAPRTARRTSSLSTRATSPAYDWNGDGVPDLIVGGESGGLYLFHHDWLSGIAHTRACNRGVGRRNRAVETAEPSREPRNCAVNAVTATSLAPPPPWAFMQRRLIDTMEQATEAMLAKYTEPGGALYFADDVDDLYERFANWSLFYAMGAPRAGGADGACSSGNATTRWCDDGVVNRLHHHEFHMNLGERGRLRRTFNPQIHREYYNLAEPARRRVAPQGRGQHGVLPLRPRLPAELRERAPRARRFAAMYIGEDPDAPNYDPAPPRVPLSLPVQRGSLAAHTDDVEAVKSILHGPVPWKEPAVGTQADGPARLPPPG